jgi:hypothetical protein
MRVPRPARTAAFEIELSVRDPQPAFGDPVLGEAVIAIERRSLVRQRRICATGRTDRGISAMSLDALSRVLRQDGRAGRILLGPSCAAAAVKDRAGNEHFQGSRQDPFTE